MKEIIFLVCSTWHKSNMKYRGRLCLALGIILKPRRSFRGSLSSKRNGEKNTEKFRARVVAQWDRACLGCVGPWVQSSALQRLTKLIPEPCSMHKRWDLTASNNSCRRPSPHMPLLHPLLLCYRGHQWSCITKSPNDPGSQSPTMTLDHKAQ